MLITVLKNVGGHRPLEAMTSLIVGIKSNAREWFSWAKSVMITQHLRCLLDESHRFLANAVVVPCLCSFPLRYQTQNIATPCPFTFCSRSMTINNTNYT